MSNAVTIDIGHTPNYATVEVGPVTLYFSYRTVIAFSTGHGIRVRENSWGPTTGKHLNRIDGGDKKSRLSSDDFEFELARVMNTLTTALQGVSA